MGEKMAMGENMLQSLRALEASDMHGTTEIESLTALIREHKGWTGAILGYEVQGPDQRIGDVQDFIVDDQTGDIRYLVVGADGPQSSRKILLAPNWTDRINWGERKVYMDFAAQLVHESPAWVWATPLTRDYETRLHDHFRQPPYWTRSKEPDPLGHRSSGDGAETSSFGSLA